MTLDYKQILLDIVKSLVVYPDDVTVEQTENDQFLVLNCKVNDSDLGRVIGRQGHTVNSIRSILYAVAQKDNVRVRLEVKSNKEQE